MKTFIVLATLVAASSAAWVFLPIPGAGHRPEVMPPSVDPIHPNRPEIDPIFPEGPQEPILPPGILPEVPIIPPRPELPMPKPPLEEAPVHTEILNFPSDADPQIRVHVNIKQDKNSHRPVRSIFNWPNIIWPGQKPEIKPELPEMGNKPELPEMGNKPELPEMGHKPEILPPGNLPEILPPAELPTPIVPPPAEDGVHTFIYPNAQHQLVKLRVQYNHPAPEHFLPMPGPSPYKLEWLPEIGNKPSLPIWPEIGNKPELPEMGNKPELPEMGHKPELPIEPPTNLPAPEKPIHPMPVPPIFVPKVPMVELFLDIGEQEAY